MATAGNSGETNKPILKPGESVVRFDSPASPQYRSIHVDGAFLTEAPNGNWHLTVYNERTAPPQSQTFRLKGNELGDEVTELRSGGNSVWREIEANLVLSPNVAAALMELIHRQIKKQIASAKHSNQAKKSRS